MQFNAKDLGLKYVIQCCLWFLTFILACQICQSEKIRYATEDDCDRHSLDAVYHEKYKLITNNVFADTKEFVSRVADLVADSFSTIMADLPDRDVSDNEERKVHTQFKNIKDAFSSKVKKLQKNITSSWENLITSNFDLMFDNGKSSLEDYMTKTIRMAESYSEARKTLDSTLSTFVDFIKGTVRDGLSGIKIASEEAIKKEEQEKEKKEKEEDETEEITEEETTEDTTTEDTTKAETATEDTTKNKSKDDILREKMVEITKMIVPGILRDITIKVIERKMDLAKNTGIKPENRDSVLDDLQFDILLIKNRILAFIRSDVARDKGSTDLARRSIYTYWIEQADEMYKEKLRSKKSTESTNTGRLYYRNLWKDEEQLMDTLLNLMEVYP